MIQEVGFSDIVDIICDAELKMKISDRSKDGKHLKDIEVLSETTVILSIKNAEKNKDKRCYIGHIILEKYNLFCIFILYYIIMKKNF
jgi:hypothetical protein